MVVFFIDIIPYLADDGQIMGHFIAEDDPGDAIGKGFAGHNFSVHGFMVEVLTRDTEWYVEHFLPRQIFLALP
jgi:hypothetical protein